MNFNLTSFAFGAVLAISGGTAGAVTIVTLSRQPETTLSKLRQLAARRLLNAQPWLILPVLVPRPAT